MHNVVDSFEGTLSKLDFSLSARSGNHAHMFASEPILLPFVVTIDTKFCRIFLSTSFVPEVNQPDLFK